ncbi:rfaE bifunctional protein, domain I [Flexibacter flexilis DSM 6793]|uniref:RfaE bifunctional protein, domain I n=1 Tax=Flexibacter flexilis DSM 6793 TaxID=927664 RepID=A0A1I1HYV2_9BACT|nr:bifunctional ADP-heptose synthase [Flexibacter flexilis]SFC28965.1 rfaE bifunctional protein, domain I [Flexibacter flexilis DSM 6793]
MNVNTVFEDFNNLRALIIGDIMIDSYLWGKVERISPEAPVPVLNVQRREYRLGGAANVALNVQALGATPVLCAVVGDDADGTKMLDILSDNGLATEGILQSANRITTVKHRVISGSHHLLRIDSEDDSVIKAAEQEALLQKIAALLPTCQVVIFEDYDKGVLCENVIQQTIKLAQELQIPTVVDPKKRNFMHYTGASLFKPNLKELREGLKIEVDINDDAQIAQSVEQLKARLGVEAALLTLSERGMYLDMNAQKHHVPAHLRQISDVSGAGDTVVSIAALCMALRLPPRQVVELANLGGGLVCEHVGVVPINKARLKEEAEKLEI